MMDRDKLKFEKYKPVYIRVPLPMVTINIYGFAFNKLCNKYFGGAKNCEVFYDEAQKVVGIKVFDNPTGNSKMVAYRDGNKNKTGPFVAARHFLRETKATIFLGLLRPNVRSKRAIVEWDELEEMILIDLKKAA